jgi:ribosomal protein S18 acetylase RimI-like enzyme
MKIRKATLKDSKNFLELARRADRYPVYWSKSRFPNFINNSDQMIFLAEEKGKLLGFLGFMKNYSNKKAKIRFEDLGYISWIAVLPSARKRAIGSKLLKEAGKYAKKIGKKGIWLACEKDVVAFYKKNGYKLKGYFMKEYKGKKYRKYFMEKINKR